MDYSHLIPWWHTGCKVSCMTEQSCSRGTVGAGEGLYKLPPIIALNKILAWYLLLHLRAAC